MTQGSLNIRLYNYRLFSLALLSVFLLLGFCPLRNMLCYLAQPQPAKKAQPAPDYAKITSAKECAAFTVAPPRDAPPALSPGITFNFTVYCYTIFVAAPKTAPVACFSTVPLYLRNHAFRI